MRFYLIAFALILILSSCLKQSIPEAMLSAKKSGTATLSFTMNGNSINISVNDADNQIPVSNPALYITKGTPFYRLTGASEGVMFFFTFDTDTLKVGNYKISGPYPDDGFFIAYYNIYEFVHAPSDSMSFNITSIKDGHISGNFSGVLTPLIEGNTSGNIYGEPSSVPVTKGSFKNIPVFY